MKTVLLALICFFTYHVNAISQVRNPTNKVKNATENRVNQRTDQGINKGLDKAEEGIGNLFKKKKKKEKEDGAEENRSANDSNENNEPVNTTDNNSGQSSSFLDFVPGTQVIFEDKFEQDALMDFPAKWNSSGSGKIVTINGASGKWLEIEHNSYVHPVIDKPLPENCTIEFDLFLKHPGDKHSPVIFFGLTEVKDIMKENIYYRDKFYTKIGNYGAVNGHFVEYGLRFPPIGNKNDYPLHTYKNKILHVSMSINKTRVRVYFDQKKIIDLPRVLTDKMRTNFYFQNDDVMPAAAVPVFISNLRIAQGETDARSLLIKQLMTEGKTSTSDILFDVNSDIIKQESFAVIKQFGEALVSNPSLKIKIIGHTDNDGNDAANLLLSQKRAAAVKTYITENFAVAGNRIVTDGKGETEPVSPNTNAEGKAKNRRVEFVRIKI